MPCTHHLTPNMVTWALIVAASEASACGVLLATAGCSHLLRTPQTRQPNPALQTPTSACLLDSSRGRCPTSDPKFLTIEQALDCLCRHKPHTVWCQRPGTGMGHMSRTAVAVPHSKCTASCIPPPGCGRCSSGPVGVQKGCNNTRFTPLRTLQDVSPSRLVHM